MSMDIEPVVFDASDAQVVLSLAENEGLTFEDYMFEVITLGVYCAEVYIRNKLLGQQTDIYREDAAGNFTVETLTFAPFEWSEPEYTDEIFERTEELLADVSPIKAQFDEVTAEFLAPLLVELEATPASFLETAIDLRWKFSQAEQQNGRLLIDDGPDIVTIGMIG